MQKQLVAEVVRFKAPHSRRLLIYKLLRSALLSSSLVCSFFFVSTSMQPLEALENSVVPLMEKYLQLENLPINRYPPIQFSRITQALARKEERLRLVSYNVLASIFDYKQASENKWPKRLPRIVELLREMQPDILGVQELYRAQLDDLTPYLESDYDYFSRCDEGVELNGWFYRKDRLSVEKTQVWRFPSDGKGPEPYALTMVQFKDVKTGRCFAVFNTHLAFRRVDKREHQAYWISQKVDEFAKEMAVILAGDFNTFPHRLDMPDFPFYDGDYIHHIFTKGDLRDAREVSLLGHLGPLATFTNNSRKGSRAFSGTGVPGVYLDHIYVSPRVHVLVHAIEPATSKGHYPSDHMPVLIDFLVD